MIRMIPIELHTRRRSRWDRCTFGTTAGNSRRSSAGFSKQRSKAPSAFAWSLEPFQDTTPSWQLSILDFRDRFAGGKERFFAVERLRTMDVELRDLYFYIDDQVRHPPTPKLRNTDGEPIVLTTLTYRLKCSPVAAFDRLKSLARAYKGEATQLLSEANANEAGELISVTIPWNKKGNRLRKEWDNTTLGTLEIDRDRLQVRVNSSARARRIEREIAKRLGSEAVVQSRAADPIEKLPAERQDALRDPIADREHEELQRRPEVQAFLRQQVQRYWESWLDTRLPALGNRTPRQAAATPAGRERLDALLAEFTWTTERRPNPMTPDVAALRAKLGLR